MLEGGSCFRRPARGPRDLLAGCASAKSWPGPVIFSLKRKPPRTVDASRVCGRLSASPLMRRCEISAATYEVATDGLREKQRSSGSAIKHGHDSALRNAGDKPGDAPNAGPTEDAIKSIASCSARYAIRCQRSSGGGRMLLESDVHQPQRLTLPKNVIVTLAAHLSHRLRILGIVACLDRRQSEAAMSNRMNGTTWLDPSELAKPQWQLRDDTKRVAGLLFGYEGHGRTEQCCSLSSQSEVDHAGHVRRSSGHSVACRLP